MCANAYRLVLDGPSLVSPVHVLSSEVIEQRKIRVRFRLDDPGEYVAYAYPEHEKCDQWNDAETQCKHSNFFLSCFFDKKKTDASIFIVDRSQTRCQRLSSQLERNGRK